MPWPTRPINGRQFKVPFQGQETIQEGFAQAGQDLFVLSVLNGKRGGKYLELGCWEPIEINNTYLLEAQFGWTGISYDIDAGSVSRFPVCRRNPAFARDCTNLDFDQIENILGTDIDYLSIDLEPADTTLQCLKHIPFDRFQFKVITFEHDKYRFGDQVKNESRNILQQAGYDMVVSELGEPASNPFEDWYVKGVDADRIKPLYRHAVAPDDLLYT